MSQFECEYCGKTTRSSRGLAQHIRQSATCYKLHLRNEESPMFGHDSMPREEDKVQKRSRFSELEMKHYQVIKDEDTPRLKSMRKLHMESMPKMTMSSPIDKTSLLVFQEKVAKQLMQSFSYQRAIGADGYPMSGQNLNDSLDEDSNLPMAHESPSSAEEFSEEEDESSSSGPYLDDVGGDDLSEEELEQLRLRRRKTVQAFRDFVVFSHQHLLSLSPVEVKAIRIMHILIRKKAPLDTYEAVMDWHLRESGLLAKHESVGDCPHYVTRQKLLKKLRIRYHMDHQYATRAPLTLPHCRSKIQVWRKFAHDNVLSLLTDPRWTDDDWLFFDDDPCARPPENCPYVEDLNTGEAYMETYKQLIKDPTRQILVAIPLYIDGAVTGQFDKLQVTALKMSIGLLNRKARDKEYGWRNLGFVTNYAKEDYQGKKMFVESGHVAAHELYVDNTSDEEEEGQAQLDVEEDKAADYHAILTVLLQSLNDLIADGMVVDIWYKGQLYKNRELVFFVPFVKCDGDEADKLCLSFRSRTKQVEQLCRYCQCPTGDTDNPKANYPFKTEPMLKKLYEKKQVQKLRKLSQSCVKNAFHDLRFGLHNDRGVHGACPFELLHAVLLGIFKYARDCFFEQLGESSASAKDINSLAQEIGGLLQKQSDRNKPRTRFAHGILKGKLMAKEYTGVMLIIAAILQTEMGKEMLQSGKKKTFRQEGQISDWVLLIETLIQWEAYLNFPQMEKKDLQRLKKKHQFLLHLMKKVAERRKGMGFKVMKFHAVLHLAQDILMFGVPMVVDTGSNESHHKTTKVAAKLTQKDIKTFKEQTSNCLDDFHVLDLALAELDGRALWTYFDGYQHKVLSKQKEDLTNTGGMKFKVWKDEDDGHIQFTVLTRMMGRDKLQQDDDLLWYIHQIQDRLAQWIEYIPVCAEHTRNGQIFRSHPNFRGKGVWRDWVMVQWNTGNFPSKIWGFLDLQTLPEGLSMRMDDETVVRRGVWAVIESCNYVDPPAVRRGETPPRSSEIFRHIILEAGEVGQGGEPTQRKFYLVDVEAFAEPLVVIPNLGTKNQFLMMTPRDRWGLDFQKWLAEPHKEDAEEMEDED